MKFDNNRKIIRSAPLHNLEISLDYDTDPLKTYPVLLFIPHTRNTDEHYHIDLNKTQATALRDYLSEWLKPKDRK